MREKIVAGTFIMLRGIFASHGKKKLQKSQSILCYTVVNHLVTQSCNRARTPMSLHSFIKLVKHDKTAFKLSFKL